MVVDLNYIPKGWKKVKIPKVLFFQEGPGVRNWQFTETGVKLLNVGNINNGKIDLSKTSIHLSEEEANGKYKHFLVDDGDLLIACSGIVVDNFHNKIAFAKKEHLPLCLNTSTMRFKALNDEVDLNYFKYYLQTVHFTAQLRKLITGSAQLNFGPSHIKKIDLLLPPLETQKHIARILDDAAALRNKTEQLTKEYDALGQSIFADMFGDPVRNEKGWKKNKLGKLGVFKNGLNYSKTENGNRLKVIGVGDFKHFSEIKNLDNISYIEMDDFPKDDFLLKDKDLLFVRSNGNKELVGRCLIVYVGNEKVSFSGFCIRFRRNSISLNDNYLVQLLQRAEFKKYIFKNGRGANIQNINQELLSNVEIQLPPIELQNEFAKKITLIEKQKELAKQELKESENLFNCLLQKAFKGELV
ncbi:MAG: restriction endonuclease subunit S [Flavobacterium sp.]